MNATLQTTLASPEAEQAVLGALLLSRLTLDDVKDVVTREDFFVSGHSEIFDAICSVHAKGRVHDVIEVLDQLNGIDAGGIEYLSDLSNGGLVYGNIRRYAEIIAEKALARRKRLLQQDLFDQLKVIENIADLETSLALADSLLKKVQLQLPPAKMKLKYQLPDGMRADELFAREIVASDFVLPGFVAGTLGALIAPGGTGKSMLAMELAALVAGASVMGDEWPEMPLGEVLILAVEDPENELYNRWGHLGSHLDPQKRQACQRVRVVPMLGQRFDIMNDDHFQALLENCRGKRLLILDTMRRIHTLDENDGGAMALVIGRLEEIAATTGCAILFLHHVNKSATLNGQGDVQQASRGSSVLVDNIRFQMFMVGMTGKEAQTHEVAEELRGQFVRVGASKLNYGPNIGDIWLHRTDGGLLLPAVLPQSPRRSISASKIDLSKEVW